MPKHPSSSSGDVGISDDDLDTERLRARAHDVDGLRMAVGVDEEDVTPVRR